MPAISAPTEPLSDGHVVLRLSAERDIPEILIAYQDDPQLHLRLGAESPPSGAELGRREERAPGERAAGTHLMLTILEPGSDDCRGQINVHHIDWGHGRAELGIWLVPQARGRGLGSRALALVSAWLLATSGLARLQVLTEPDNEPMIRAAAAAGFVAEGVLRGYLLERGERVSAMMMSLLPSDLQAAGR